MICIDNEMNQTVFTQSQKENDFLKVQQHMKDRFFIGRLSGNETRLSGLVLNDKPIENILIQNMLYVAGIQFKTKQDLIDYVELYDRSCKNSTMLGVWDAGMYKQAELYYPRITSDTICAHSLEPYYFMNMPEYDLPSMYKDKKVLIITSHYHTTKSQIKNIHTIYSKPIFHETTEFIIYKPPQQNGGSHDEHNWKHHFDIMKKEIEGLLFDIALVSCGGFGMIISDYIYSLGANVIYVGGALQLFFGIDGSRWNKKDFIKPFEEDKPKYTKLCENSCYW